MTTRSSAPAVRTIRTRSTTYLLPFHFPRCALDVGASTITEEMKLAAVKAIAELARAEQSEIVASAYGEKVTGFGPEYLIPKPFDPRLIVKIAPAVAKAGMDSGVATRRSRLGCLPQSLNNSSTTRPDHEAGVLAGQAQPEAHRLCRGRG